MQASTRLRLAGNGVAVDFAGDRLVDAHGAPVPAAAAGLRGAAPAREPAGRGRRQERDHGGGLAGDRGHRRQPGAGDRRHPPGDRRRARTRCCGPCRGGATSWFRPKRRAASLSPWRRRWWVAAAAAALLALGGGLGHGGSRRGPARRACRWSRCCRSTTVSRRRRRAAPGGRPDRGRDHRPRALSRVRGPRGRGDRAMARPAGRSAHGRGGAGSRLRGRGLDRPRRRTCADRRPAPRRRRRPQPVVGPLGPAREPTCSRSRPRSPRRSPTASAAARAGAGDRTHRRATQGPGEPERIRALSARHRAARTGHAAGSRGRARPARRGRSSSIPVWRAPGSRSSHCRELLANFGVDPARNRELAYAAATRALALDPSDAEAHAVYGSALGERNDFVRAEAEFDTALRLAPERRRDPDLLHRLGVDLRRARARRRAGRPGDPARPELPDLGRPARSRTRTSWPGATRGGGVVRAAGNRDVTTAGAGRSHAAALAAAGRRDEAAALRRAGARGLSRAQHRGDRERRPGWSEAEHRRFVETMRLAGFPPCAAPEALAEIAQPRATAGMRAAAGRRRRARIA